MVHTPVLLREVLSYLDPKPNENFIDATFGFGGHSAAILAKTEPAGKVLGIEWDSQVYDLIKKRLAEIPKRLILVNGSFVDLEEILKQVGEQCRDSSPLARNDMVINGILFDLGFSSWHIEESGRGFSFLREEPLDMRYQSQAQNSKFKALPSAKAEGQNCSEKLKTNHLLTAAKIVNQWSETALIDILKEYGEERFTRRIAGAICRERQIAAIKSTKQLAELIEKNVPPKYRYARIHPATRTFQALRIAVNDELNNLKKGLASAIKILSPRGRLVIISFHSLEDRIVKYFFRDQKQAGNLKILTKKPVVPTDQERKTNPRSRSAKLRAAIRISN